MPCYLRSFKCWTLDFISESWILYLRRLFVCSTMTTATTTTTREGFSSIRFFIYLCYNFIYLFYPFFSPLPSTTISFHFIFFYLTRKELQNMKRIFSVEFFFLSYLLFFFTFVRLIKRNKAVTKELKSSSGKKARKIQFK